MEDSPYGGHGSCLQWKYLGLSILHLALAIQKASQTGLRFRDRWDPHNPVISASSALRKAQRALSEGKVGVERLVGAEQLALREKSPGQKLLLSWHKFPHMVELD